MKKQVFYIHGGDSFKEHNTFIEDLKTKEIWNLPTLPSSTKWTHSLVANLGGEYEVFTPDMPNKQNADYTEWKIWFERHFEHLRDEVILVGYSLGAMFLAKYLTKETPPFTIKALFLLASPVEAEDFDDTTCGSFTFPLKKAGKIKEKAEKITIIHSKDDFVVPYEHSLILKETLPEATLVTYEDKNHFLIEKFPELIKMIKAV